jgi:hypothetical protein
MDDTAGRSTVFRNVSSSTAAAIGTVSNHTFQILTNNTSRIFLTETGNVGIGTITPSASLHISGASSANLLRIESPASSSILFVSGSGNVGIGTTTPYSRFTTYGALSTSTSQISIINSEGGHTILRTGISGLTNSGFSLISANVDGTNQNTRLVISSACNVGIGETSPTARLQVKGSGATSSTTAFRVENANASGSMVVLDDGNVGIGTTTPSSSLHISSNTGNTLFRITSGSNNVINVGSSSVAFFSSTGTPNAGFDIDVQGNAPNAGTMRIAGSGTVYNFSPQGSITRPGTNNAELFNLVMGGISPTAIQNTLRVQFDANQNPTSGSGYTVLRVNATHASTAGTGSKLLQTWEFGNVTQSVMNISGSLGLGLTNPSASLHISGASSANLLRIDSPASSSILYVSGSGNVGIATSTPTQKLHIAGTSTTVAIQGSNTAGGTQGIQFLHTSTSAAGYIGSVTTSGGGSGTLIFSTITSGSGELMRITNTGFVGIGETSPGARLEVKGAGATSATTTFLLENSTPSALMRVLDNGQFTYSGPLLSLASSQSAFVISQSISQSAIIGAQVYGVNITPTFFATTSSQTETAFRVNAIFTGSAASTGSTNIIADFGAVSAGSQLTVTDVTSGSIYIVSDVSGLPIIEATSDWTVNMYNFPNIIFQKTGSNVNITGSLNVTGSLILTPTSSFVLPLTASLSPQTGSAFWSGSFLYVYNGTRYMSSSFA